MNSTYTCMHACMHTYACTYYMLAAQISLPYMSMYVWTRLLKMMYNGREAVSTTLASFGGQVVDCILIRETLASSSAFLCACDIIYDGPTGAYQWVRGVCVSIVLLLTWGVVPVFACALLLAVLWLLNKRRMLIVSVSNFAPALSLIACLFVSVSLSLFVSCIYSLYLSFHLSLMYLLCIFKAITHLHEKYDYVNCLCVHV